MYTTLTLIVLVGISIASGFQKVNPQSQSIQRIVPNFNQGNGTDLCPTCIHEAVLIINTLLNAILDEGILATCGDLCSFVANKTDSKALGDLCDVVCDAFGIDEFVKALVALDIDPIYYCELVMMCPINDQGDAKFTNFGISPTTGNRGTKFLLDCSFATKNGTGTSSYRIVVVDPNKAIRSEVFWFEAKKPGSYIEKIALDTIEQTCDPALGLCDDWPVGTYNVTAEICNGECGSHHPHTSVYDMGKASFTVTA